MGKDVALMGACIVPNGGSILSQLFHAFQKLGLGGPAHAAEAGCTKVDWRTTRVGGSSHTRLD